jgi:hypothetical protein
MGDETCRVAIMNCDWDHMTSEDLLVLTQSFCPGTASVTKCTVYVSEYGAVKLKEEVTNYYCKVSTVIY